MAKNKHKRISAKRAVLTFLCIFLGIVLAGMLGVTLYAEHLLNQLNYIEPAPTVPQETVHASEPAASTETTQPAVGGKDLINVLLIGQDTRTAERGRSDSMILVTINKPKKTITLTSFMRDLYVPIPGYSANRINAAYAFGGTQLLDQTLADNFGIEVDGNVEVDFQQFSSIIDLLGGVEMELTGTEAWYINMVAEGDYVHEGTNLLDGKLALIYARDRTDVGSDFGRTNRQRKILIQIMEKYRKSKLTTMLATLEQVLPMVSTDFTKSEIIGYAAEILPIFSKCEIVTQRIPVDDGYYDDIIAGMMVLVPNMEVNRQALVDSLAP